jgi:hypothetical protein
MNKMRGFKPERRSPLLEDGLFCTSHERHQALTVLPVTSDCGRCFG